MAMGELTFAGSPWNLHACCEIHWERLLIETKGDHMGGHAFQINMIPCEWVHKGERDGHWRPEGLHMC